MTKSLLFLLYALIISGFPKVAFGFSNRPTYNLDESAKIEQLIKSWNDAINNNQPEKLNNLYADRVIYYLNDFSRKQCVDSKASWLSKHKDYRQKILGTELTRLYKSSKIIISANFQKEYTNNGKKAVVQAFLEFENSGKGWKIVKESDSATEAKRFKDTGPVTLPKGKYSFSGGLYIETEDEQGDLNYSLLLNIGDEITGSYNFWSYVTRTTFSYTVTKAKLENGILELWLVFDEESGNQLEEEGQIEKSLEITLRFKIMSEKELFELDDVIPVSLFLDDKTDN